MAADLLIPVPVTQARESNTVTRTLCAATHLDGGFTDLVLGELLDPGWFGVAPNWHLDNELLARHATLAYNRRQRRDVNLVWVFSAGLACMGSAVLSLLMGYISAWTAMAGLVGGFVAAYLVALVLISQHYWRIHASAVAAVDDPGNDTGLPLLDFSAVQELTAHRHANLALFGGRQPFIGSGQTVEHWSITVDITRGALTRKGERKEPKTFGTKELQDALLAQTPRRVLAEAPRLRPACGYRLYGIGTQAPNLRTVFRAGPAEFDREDPFVPDEDAAIRFGRPIMEASDELITRALNEPDAAMRPYTYYEVCAQDGMLIVTLFCRIVVRSPVLYAEFTVCTLRPPAGSLRTVNSIPRGMRSPWWMAVNTAVPTTFPLLIGAPVRVLTRRWDDWRGKVKDRRTRRMVKHRVDADFSANPSLREQVAVASAGDHFIAMDETMCIQVLSQRAMEVLGDFLRDHHVDTKDFNEQALLVAQNQMVTSGVINGGPFVRGGAPGTGGADPSDD